jgi:hypothetical protein
VDVDEGEDFVGWGGVIGPDGQEDATGELLVFLDYSIARV